MRQTVMVVGCNGQLGAELVRQLASGVTGLGAVPAFYQNAKIVALDYPEMDITKQTALLAQVQEIAPTIIFNCAAYTNVDGCEDHRDEALFVNAIGARNLAMAAENIQAKLVHLSTDYVFSGQGTAPYRENDLPAPGNEYGYTKLLGEKYVQAFCRHWFIVRTAWLYGRQGKNFVRTIMRVARENGAVTVVNDQRGVPTNAEDLAYHLLKLAATEEYGIFHCTGNGECSWYDFAVKIVELAGIQASVNPCTSAEYTSKVKRPAYSVLAHDMLRLCVGDEMRLWDDALDAFFAQEAESQA